MKIKQFNSAVDFNQLRSEINQALEGVGKKYGVNFQARNASYLDQVATFKLELTTLGEGGTVETKEAKEFKSMATLYGMKPEDLGKTVTIQGRKFEITGMKPKSRNCITGKDSSGRGYKLPLAGVKRSLGYAVTAMDETL